jgi:hypothetical protein
MFIFALRYLILVQLSLYLFQQNCILDIHLQGLWRFAPSSQRAEKFVIGVIDIKQKLMNAPYISQWTFRLAGATYLARLFL